MFPGTSAVNKGVSVTRVRVERHQSHAPLKHDHIRLPEARVDLSCSLSIYTERFPRGKCQLSTQRSPSPGSHGQLEVDSQVSCLCVMFRKHFKDRYRNGCSKYSFHTWVQQPVIRVGVGVSCTRPLDHPPLLVPSEADIGRTRHTL